VKKAILLLSGLMPLLVVAVFRPLGPPQGADRGSSGAAPGTPLGDLKAYIDGLIGAIQLTPRRQAAGFGDAFLGIEVVH
jgi:hypothetical protein